MSRFVDFDRMYRELRRETIRMRVMGEELEIACSVPASVVLLLMRFEAEDAVPAQVLIEAGSRVFGAARIEKWAEDARFSMDMLAQLLKLAFELISGEADKQTEVCVTEDGQQAVPTGASRN